MTTPQKKILLFVIGLPLVAYVVYILFFAKNANSQNAVTTQSDSGSGGAIGTMFSMLSFDISHLYHTGDAPNTNIAYTSIADVYTRNYAPDLYFPTITQVFAYNMDDGYIAYTDIAGTTKLANGYYYYPTMNLAFSVTNGYMTFQIDESKPGNLESGN